MREWLSKHKNEIITGIITGIICTIIGTLISSVWHYFIAFVPRASNFLLRSLIDGIYYVASDLTHSSILKTLLFILMLPTMLLPIVLVIILTIEKKEKLKEVKLENDIEDDATGGTHSIETKNYKEKGNKNITKKLKIIGLLVSSTFTFFLLFTYVLIPMVIWDNFERDITIIAPYMEEKEILTLRSDWARMTTRDDYSKIYTLITTKKIENNILP